MVLTVEGIVLYSEDLDRARAFYRDILGLPLLLDEGHVIHFDAGTIRLAIHRCPPGQRRVAPEGFLVFGVEDLAVVHEALRLRGAEFLGPPANRPYGRFAGGPRNTAPRRRNASWTTARSSTPNTRNPSGASRRCPGGHRWIASRMVPASKWITWPSSRRSGRPRTSR